jgi:effector-binding domain-containing protein
MGDRHSPPRSRYTLWMVSPVRVVEVSPCELAVLRSHASLANLSHTIQETFDRFYQAPPPVARGLNVVYYHGDPAGSGTTIDIGVEVLEPFQPSGDLLAVSTPGGVALTVTHLGPYNRLGEAYNTILHWLRENGRQPLGPFWEVYGHGTDDPAQLRTDIFYLLK